MAQYYQVALIFIVSCCSEQKNEPIISSPNIAQACIRTEMCGVFMREQHESCVACLERIDQTLLSNLRFKYGDVPPLKQYSCKQLLWVNQTNLRQCVVARRYGL